MERRREIAEAWSRMVFEPFASLDKLLDHTSR
jgi:hypothetical protein